MCVKVLTISNLYPNTVQPRNGIFIEHRIRQMHQSNRIAARVVAPVPWFPITNARFGKYAVSARVPRADDRHGIHVLYPRYLAIPKIGMTLAPALLATALIRPLRRLIHSGYDFDVIDAYYFYPDGIAAALLGLYFRKPVVITALGTDVNMISRYSFPRRMIRWAATNAAGVTTVSRSLKDRLVELGVAADSILVNLHGVDHELFRPPSDRAALRARLGLTHTTLLMVGNLVELKGHHIAIRALASLDDVDLLIVGEGTRKRWLKGLAESLGLGNRVRFLGDVDQSRLRDYYGAADALVLPSSREGIPNVVLESMACGTPVVVTNVGGLPEIITAPEAGKLMSQRTPEALARAVHGLLAAYPDRAATHRFALQFSWERTTELHIGLLDRVLARRAER